MPSRQQLTERWKTIISAWSPSDWQAYAARRLQSLLKTHFVCSTREMEARLSDFGSNLIPRVDPHHLTTARHSLKLNKVSRRIVPLYSLPNTPISSLTTIITRKELLHEAFRNFTKDHLCGDVAENIVYNSMVKALNLSIEPHILGNVSQIGTLKTNNPLDTYALLPFIDKTAKRQVAQVGIEIKNIREWIYPDSVEIWKALKACIDLDCIPVIISRTFHYTAFAFFRDIGVFALETRKQYLSTKLWKDPLYTPLKTELYFRDMILWKEDKPEPRITSFFTTLLPQYISRTALAFEHNKQLIAKYAQGPLHDENTNISDRSRLMSEFREEFRLFHNITETKW